MVLATQAFRRLFRAGAIGRARSKPQGRGAIYATSALNTEKQTYRAGLQDTENEVSELTLALESPDRPTSLSGGTWARHFWEVLLRSLRSDTFVKGALEVLEDDAKFGHTPADQTARERLFYFATHLDAKAAAKRAAEAEARARHPQASKDMSAPKDTGRAAEDTKPGPPKDQPRGPPSACLCPHRGVDLHDIMIPS